MPKVSIVVTAHNYAKYLPKSLESALGQSFDDLEVVVVDDGSTDHTAEVLARYAADPRLKIVTTEGVGLAAASNRGIAASSGEYIVRLDADDWFDENLVLVEARFLDKHPNVGLVYCDYCTVDTHGELIDRVRRARVNEEVELLDRPCLAAGAMYRRKCFEAIGGYDESIRYQEDYDFWIKFIEKFEVRNISLPLMYYRQHGHSMSRNWDARMKTRREVKKRFVEEHRERFKDRVLAVVPARGDRLNGGKLALLPLGNETLLARSLAKLNTVDMIDRIVVSTDDPEVAEAARALGAEVPYLRGRTESETHESFESVLFNLLKWLHEHDGYDSDAVVIVHPHSPFIEADHVTEALDTLLLYETDSVIGVVEDLTYHWTPSRHGLAPVGYQKRVVRQEKDLVYKEAGGLYIVRSAQFLASHDLLGRNVGHIELSQTEAVRVQTAFDYWVARGMAETGGRWTES
ncbi:MAG: glycosyltransferase [Alphaproteobacteria bacterium]